MTAVASPAHLILLNSSSGSNEAVCAAAETTAATPAAPAPQQRDQIATIVGAERARRGTCEGGDGDGVGPGEETEAADFANYFYSYAELDHQKQMLEDERCSIRQPDRHHVECALYEYVLVEYNHERMRISTSAVVSTVVSF